MSECVYLTHFYSTQPQLVTEVVRVGVLQTTLQDLVTYDCKNGYYVLATRERGYSPIIPAVVDVFFTLPFTC